MEAQEEWPGEFHLWHTKARMLVYGEERGTHLGSEGSSDEAEAHPGRWGQEARADPPSEAPRSVQNLLLGVCGLFLGSACCPGCCTSCFWKENRGSWGWQPCYLAHYPSRCHCWRSGRISTPVMTWSVCLTAGTLQEATHLSLSHHPYPSPFHFSSCISPSIRSIPCKQYKLDSSASNPTAGT